ncbi:MAG: CRISPR-associated endonuclease Cas2 [Methanomicrobia archaeon]|nr:CRISPR-associated endonuclease Cas2 [Methanomicrobia archaeon]
MKKERYIYVVYDIENNPTRTFLSRRLAYYGLRRVQYSVFNGVVPLHDKEALVREINELELDEEDKIHVIDLCEGCRREAIIIGKMPEVREHVVI